MSLFLEGLLSGFLEFPCVIPVTDVFRRFESVRPSSVDIASKFAALPCFACTLAVLICLD